MLALEKNEALKLSPWDELFSNPPEGPEMQVFKEM